MYEQILLRRKPMEQSDTMIRAPKSLRARINQLCIKDEIRTGKRPTQAEKLDEIVTKEELEE
jgi:hypothetical protein